MDLNEDSNTYYNDTTFLSDQSNNTSDIDINEIAKQQPYNSCYVHSDLLESFRAGNVEF